MKKKFLYIFLTILLCLTMVLPFMANALEKPLAITASAQEIEPLAENDDNFIIPEENKLNYDQGINSYGQLSFFNPFLYDNRVNCVINLDLTELSYKNFNIYVILGDNSILSQIYFLPNGDDWANLRFLNSYSIYTMYYSNITSYIGGDSRLVLSFNTIDIDMVAQLQYNIVIKELDEATPEYFLGYNQGVKYDQTQVVEGSASWNSAYEKGYNDYENDNAYGPFVGATYDAIFDYVNTPQIILRDQIPQLSYNYLTFPRSIYETYIEIPEMLDNYVDVEIVINLKDPVLYSNYTLSRFGDDANILGSYFEDIDGVRYSVSNEIPIDNSYNIFAMKIDNLSPPNKTVQIKKIGLIYGRPLDTFPNSGITISEGGYLVGYNSGINDGKEIGRNEGIETGKEIGRKEGEEIGYEKAVLNGVSASGIFNSTIAIISTCFTLAGTFLGTKIAGDLTIGLFVIGIPATFMIINLIISLVKNLLSAGGSKGGDD